MACTKSHLSEAGNFWQACHPHGLSGIDDHLIDLAYRSIRAVVGRTNAVAAGQHDPRLQSHQGCGSRRQLSVCGRGRVVKRVGLELSDVEGMGRFPTRVIKLDLDKGSCHRAGGPGHCGTEADDQGNSNRQEQGFHITHCPSYRYVIALPASHGHPACNPDGPVPKRFGALWFYSLGEMP